MIDEQSYRDLKAWAEDIAKQAAEWEKKTRGHIFLFNALGKVVTLLNTSAQTADHMVNVIQYARVMTENRMKNADKELCCNCCHYREDGSCPQSYGDNPPPDGYCLLFEKRTCQNCASYSDGICAEIGGKPRESDELCMLWSRKGK